MGLSWFFQTLLFCTLLASTCLAVYEDARCKCVCVDRLGSYNGTKPTRKIYVAAVAADKCVCKLMLGKDSDLCPYCDCKYQVRSTTTIKVVVCLILTIVSALTLYMLFLLLLEPLLSAHRAGRKLLSSQPETSSSYLGSDSTTSVGAAANTSTLVHSRRSFIANVEVPWIRGVTPVSKASEVSVSWNRDKPGTGDLLNIEDSFTDESPDRTRVRQRGGSRSNLLVLRSNRAPSAPGVAAAVGVSTVVKTVRDQQQRWKGNVEAQRARVFSEHTLLN